MLIYRQQLTTHTYLLQKELVRRKIYDLAPHRLGKSIRKLAELCKLSLYASVCESIFTVFGGKSDSHSWYPVSCI